MRADANSPPRTSRPAWIARRSRSRRGSQRTTSAHARSFWRPHPPAIEIATSASSVRHQRRREQREQRRGVGAHDRRPAIALHVAPFGGALLELVLVVDDGAWLDPDPSPREPQPQREVDVLVVEEELAREAAGALPPVTRDREAGSRGEPDLAGLGRGGGVEPPARAARPRDAREVNDAALGVDDAAARGRHEAHPGSPAAIVVERAGDRGAKPLRDHGVGVEEQKQLARRAGGAGVAPRGEAEVGARLDQGGAGSELANRLGGAVGGRVVDDDQLVALAKLLDERRQRAPHRLPAVVGHDHDRETGQEPAPGLEPGTPSLRMKCSTN